MEKSKIFKWILAIAIVIVLNLFFSFTIQLGYKEPRWETFCPLKQVNRAIDNEKACTDVGGQWNDYGATGEKILTPSVKVSPTQPAPQPTGYCNEQYTCQKNFNDAFSVYNRNVFIILIILGVISIGAGYAVGTSAAVSLGLSLGGVLSLIIASMRYWSNMQDLLRVVILGVALAALIWFGIKKFKD